MSSRVASAVNDLQHHLQAFHAELEKLLHRGFHPIPVPLGQKKPVIPDWQHLDVTLANYRDHFRSVSNIGLLLREDFADADLDSREALVLADAFLPQTNCIWGRPSKPRSHRLYRLTGATRHRAFLQGDDMVVELRHGAHHSLVPPSLHPSGESFAWARFGEVTLVDADKLSRAVAMLAVAALLARVHPPFNGAREGRHEFRLVVAGLLARNFHEKDATRIWRGMLHAAGDPKALEREDWIADTSKKLRAGIAVPGIPRLKELIGEKTSGLLLGWIGQANPAAAPSVSFTPPPTDETPLANRIREVVLDRDIQAFDKRRKIADLIAQHLSTCGEFLQTSDARGFYFSHGEQKLYDVAEEQFSRLLTEISGLSVTETFFKFALDILQTLTLRRGRLVDVHVFSHYDADTHQLIVSDGGSRVWCHNPGGAWEPARNGENGIFFLTDSDATPWEPEFKGCELAEAWWLQQFLFDSDAFTIEESRVLLSLLVRQQFFPPLRRTRVIPAFLGPQGSGKTSGVRLYGRLLLGEKFDVTGVQRDREDAYVAAITNRTVLGLDNVDSKIPWLPDALALYATGQRYRLRRLYTTNEEVSYSPRAILLLSSRDPRFNRPDVTERLLPFNFTRPELYMAEEQIFSELAKRRGQIMGALLSSVAQIADTLRTQPPTAVAYRMADFAVFGHRIYSGAGRGDEFLALLKKVEKRQAEFAADGDGVIAALAVLLNKIQGTTVELPVGELYKQTREIADSEGFAFPANAQGFGQRLSAMRRVIAIELGATYSEFRGHARHRIIRLAPVKLAKPGPFPVQHHERNGG